MPPLGHVCLSQAEDGQRLDQVLALLVPDMGLRGRRRLISSGRVLINGIVRDKSYKVHAGQELTLETPDETASQVSFVILANHDNYAALSKPAGVHCQTLSGKHDVTVEGALSQLFPHTDARLLNRLDKDTSGIVMVGLNDAAEVEFRRAENTCSVEKKYVAVVDGHVEMPLTLRFCLDTADRKRSRILNEDTDDPARFTDVLPITYFEDDNVSVVAVRIIKGARHQIRAHLSFVGHPLINDILYDGPVRSVAGVSSEYFWLHHQSISFPGFQTVCPVSWSWCPEIELQSFEDEDI